MGDIMVAYNHPPILVDSHSTSVSLKDGTDLHFPCNAILFFGTWAEEVVVVI